jgi:hypothetical protein
MALSWLDFPDGSKMETVRNKINTFNNSVVTEYDNIIQQFNVVDDQILALDNRVTDLENVSQPFAPYYHFTKATNIDVPSDTYSTVGELHRTDVDATGTYEVKFSGSYSLDSTTSSAYIRFTIDGGGTWYEYRREPKDKTDLEAFYYSFPTVFTSNDVDIIVEARKENSGDTMTITFLDIILERKL